MKSKYLILFLLLNIANISCSDDKSINEISKTPPQNAYTVLLDHTINGTWIISNIQGEGGISKDIKFIFDNNQLTLNGGYYKDKVKMLSGDSKSLSYKDQNDIKWDYNYSISGNTLKLEHLLNNKVYTTYTLKRQ